MKASRFSHVLISSLVVMAIAGYLVSAYASSVRWLVILSFALLIVLGLGTVISVTYDVLASERREKG